jgi:ABC-2 type transport system ATP-binding protein
MIHVHNLVKQFGSKRVVNDISFEVQKGEIFAFLGPNGAGKTTTIRMLTTLLAPTEGEVRLNGLNPALDKDGARKQFGIVFQDPSLDQEMTGWENMLLHGVLYHVPHKMRRERTERLLKLFGLWDQRNSIARTFSAGMRRRLEIARSLLHTPPIVFLDEPSLALDPQSRNQLWTQIKRLNEIEEVTIFMTTHYMDEAERMAHRIAVIDQGKLVAIGSAQQLKDRTEAESLEEAFLSLTGTCVRTESASPTEQMRQLARIWNA